MALTDRELDRVRYELRHPVLSTSAEPYVGIVAYFTTVLQATLLAGASTTSSTAVTAATSATPVTLTLTSATGFAAGSAVVVDVDERQEIAVAQTLSGTSLTVQLKLAHSGTYPVTVEGGEAIVRDILRQLRVVAKLQEEANDLAGIGPADDVTFATARGESRAERLQNERMRLRDELSGATGVPNLWRKMGASARVLALY